MKNWNDSGTVHYDADTNALYKEWTVDFVACEIRFDLTVNIPLRMREILKDEHFEHARQVAIECAGGFLTYGTGRDRAALIVRAADSSRQVMLEDLYNSFTLEQARLGNQVWAVPELVDKVGPRPEDDDLRGLR